MADLVSMKRTPSEKDSGEITTFEERDFPHGLTLHLDDATIEKLGIAGDIKAGDTVLIAASATVSSVSTHDSEEEGSTNNITLQITDMAVDTDHNSDHEGDDKAKADRMFGKTNNR